MMTLGTWLFTVFSGSLVGSDEFGNKYYTLKRPGKRRRPTRWVAFKGIAEATKVPPLWHSWLHYTIDTPPSQNRPPHHRWEKEHLPNLTGTAEAYLPPGDIRRGADRAATTSDYQPWTPS